MILYHYLVRWTPPNYSISLYPYGSALSDIGLAKYGWLGVQLFFIISGFVIAMTLTRCKSALEFVVRRYSRLAPAMLIFSILTFAALALVPSGPFHPKAAAFISSLFFVDPADLNRLFKTDFFESIDGAYWSLYVEVKFYALAALLYFFSKQRFAIYMALVAVVSTTLHAVRIPGLSGLADMALIPQHLPWFVIGIGFYLRHKDVRNPVSLVLIGLGIGLNLVTSLVDTEAAPAWACLLVPGLFICATEVSAVRKILSLRFFAIVGAASYSLYLVHQSVGVTLLSQAGDFWSAPASGFLLAILIAAGCISLCVASFRVLEQPLSRSILAFFGYSGHRSGTSKNPVAGAP